MTEPVPSLDQLVAHVRDACPEAEPLEQLAAAVALLSELTELGDDLVGHFVDAAREAGCSWAQIGGELGVTRQAAHQRFAAPWASVAGAARRLGKRRPSPGGSPLSRFSDQGRRVVVLAQEEARRLRHNYLGTEHLLLGVLRDEESAAARALRSLGVTVEGTRRAVLEEGGTGPGEPPAAIPFTPRSKKVLELAVLKGGGASGDLIGPDHVLLALVLEGQGMAAKVLAGSGAGPAEVARALNQAREDGPGPE